LWLRVDSSPVMTSGQHRHSVYYWVCVKPGEEIAALRPEAVAEKCGVPVKELFRYWEKEVNCDRAVKTLPRTLTLIFCFAAMLLNHETVGETQSVEKAIRFDIEENANFAFNGIGTMGHKNYQDVNSITDFYSWLRLGFAAIYLPQSTPVSEGSDLTSTAMTSSQKLHLPYLDFNRKLGPVKLTKEAAQVDECQNKEASRLGRPCFEKGTDFVIQPREFDVAFTPFTEDPSENGTVWLPLAQDVNPTVDDLEMTGWITRSTRRWKLSFVTYNAEFDILTVTNIHFILSRSGRIWKEMSFMSFFMSPYDHPGAGLVWEILFFGVITSIFLEELVEIFQGLCIRGTDGKCRFRPRQCFMEYLTIWNAVDWCSIVIAYIILGLWIYRCTMLADVKSLLGDAVEVCDTKDQGNCDAMMDMLMVDATRMGEISSGTSLVASFYPFCILLRLFKTFSLQPRLAVVTRTLWMSFADLVHFGIIFLSVFLTYVFMGMGFFGRTVEGYASFGVAFTTQFRSLMGDADFEALENKVGRAIAGVFHISFMLCMLLILLNMLIAIIMDVYSETKKNAHFSDPVWIDIIDFFKRWYHTRRGSRISLSKAKDLYITYLEEKADATDKVKQSKSTGQRAFRSKKSFFAELEASEDIVTTEDLMSKAGMDRDQAWDSVLEAVKLLERSADLEVSTVEVLRGVRQVQSWLGVPISYGSSATLPASEAPCKWPLFGHSEATSSTEVASDLRGEADSGPAPAKEGSDFGPDLRSLLAESIRRLEFENTLSARSRKTVEQLLDTAQALLKDEVEKSL